MRLIDADAYAFPGDLSNEPTIEAEPVRHGRWMTQEYQYGVDGEEDYWEEKPAEKGDCAYCSLCLKNAGLNGCEDYVLSKYCAEGNHQNFRRR